MSTSLRERFNPYIGQQNFSAALERGLTPTLAIQNFQSALEGGWTPHWPPYLLTLMNKNSSKKNYFRN